MQSPIDWTEIISGVLVGVLSFFFGHRRGRKVHRSGDYIHYKVPREDE